MPERELATTSEAPPAQVAAEVAPTLPLAALGNQTVSRLATGNVLARQPPTQTPAPASSADLVTS